MSTNQFDQPRFNLVTLIENLLLTHETHTMMVFPLMSVDMI
jgi:hypothetical protein